MSTLFCPFFKETAAADREHTVCSLHIQNLDVQKQYSKYDICSKSFNIVKGPLITIIPLAQFSQSGFRAFTYTLGICSFHNERDLLGPGDLKSWP